MLLTMPIDTNNKICHSERSEKSNMRSFAVAQDDKTSDFYINNNKLTAITAMPDISPAIER